MAQHMQGGQGRVGVLPEQRGQRVDQLAPGLLGGLGIADLQGPGQQVVQHLEGVDRSARLGPGQQQPAGRLGAGQGLLELIDQPAFAQAGVAHHGDAAQAAVGGHGGQRGQHRAQLGGPAHHRRGQAGDAAVGHPEGGGPALVHQVAAQR